MTRKLLTQANKVTNPGRRNVRTTVRGSVTKNTIITGNENFGSISTIAGGVGAFNCVMSAGTGLGRVNSPIDAVARLYSNYKYLPGTVFHYVPAVGTTTSGSVTVAYVDNAEVMAAAVLASITPATFGDFVRGAANAKTYSIWESFTYPIMPAVRKLYNVNASLNPGVATPDEYERTTQGMFLISVESAPSNLPAVGRIWVHTNIQLENLRGVVNT